MTAITGHLKLQKRRNREKKFAQKKYFYPLPVQNTLCNRDIRSMRRRLSFFLLVALTATSSQIKAQQTTTIYEEYGKLVQHRGSIVRQDEGLFGDQLSLYSGALEFVQSDTNIVGNNMLSIGVSRRFTPQQPVSNNDGLFADWDIEIPHFKGVFSNSKNWPTTGSGFTSYKRCSEFGAPPEEVAQQSGSGGYFSPGEYWQGNSIYFPGSGSEEIIIRDTAVTPPSDGRSYPLTTKSGVMIGCLDMLDSGLVGAGEGFEVLTTDGIRYRFDHMVKRQTSTLVKSSGAPEPLRVATTSSVGLLAVNGYQLRRNEVLILPTLATDRHGNSVSYNWGGTDGWALLSIVGNDGRRLDFTYLGGNYPHRVASISNGNGTWSYSYSGDQLTQVQLPDGTQWRFDLSAIRFMPDYVEGGGCGSAASPMYGSRVGTIIHPSGAIGTFTLSPVTMGRSEVPNACVVIGSPVLLQGYDRYPLNYVQAALTSKVLQGPGLPETGVKWLYEYGPANACYQGSCSSSAERSRTITITHPEGRLSRHVFGNQFQVNEGQLLQTEEGISDQTTLRTTNYSYAEPNAGPYPTSLGRSINARSDTYLDRTHYRPVLSKVISEGGNQYEWRVASDCDALPHCFDKRARPTKIIETSSP